MYIITTLGPSQGSKSFYLALKSDLSTRKKSLYVKFESEPLGEVSRSFLPCFGHYILINGRMVSREAKRKAMCASNSWCAVSKSTDSPVEVLRIELIGDLEGIPVNAVTIDM